MSIITTKTGDDGNTGLCNGERVAKDDLRIELNGTIDELCAWLGLVKAESRSEEYEVFDALQQQLMRIMGIVAGSRACDDEASLQEAVNRMESYITAHRDRAPFAFVRPGTSRMNALLHIARTKARTCERRFITLTKTSPFPDVIKVYFNRLSDYLFVKALLGQ